MAAPWKHPAIIRFLTIGGCLVVGLVGYLLDTRYSCSDVYIDNFSDHDVELLLDGHPWLTLECNCTQLVKLQAGDHEIIVRKKPHGDQLDRMAMSVEGHTRYVLNVLGAQVYYRGEAQYSFNPAIESLTFEQPAEERVQSKWFQVRERHVFEPPPEKTEGDRVQTYLRRQEE